MENNKKYIFGIILLVIVIAAVGTYAWMTYRTNKTAMVLTIGDITTMEVKLAPYQIKGTLSEVAAYTSGVMTDVTAKNSSASSKKFNLYYKINSIDTTLASANLKYTITRSTNGGTSYSTYKNGNFANTKADSELVIMDETLPAGQTYKYKVYLWLNSGSSGARGSFDGELRAEIISLPGGYQRVEYIQSTGTQWINTQIPLFDSTDHAIVIDFEPTAIYNYNSVWGTSYDADTFESWIYSTGKLAGRYNSVRYATDTTLTVNTRYILQYRKNGTALSGILNGNSIGSGTANNKITTASFYLFLSGSDYGKYKLYSCKLYKDGNLVANLVPCYRIDDALNSVYTPGLYDTVTNTFYGNNGSGTFTYGAAI